MTEDAFRQMMRELLEQGKPAEVLLRYRAYAADCERNGTAISLETLDIVEEALDALDKLTPKKRPGEQKSGAKSNRPGIRKQRTPRRWAAISVGVAGAAALSLVFGVHYNCPLAPPVATVLAPAAPDLGVCMAEGERLYQSGDYAGA